MSSHYLRFVKNVFAHNQYRSTISLSEILTRPAVSENTEPHNHQVSTDTLNRLVSIQGLMRCQWESLVHVLQYLQETLKGCFKYVNENSIAFSIDLDTYKDEITDALRTDVDALFDRYPDRRFDLHDTTLTKLYNELVSVLVKEKPNELMHIIQENHTIDTYMSVLCFLVKVFLEKNTTYSTVKSSVGIPDFRFVTEAVLPPVTKSDQSVYRFETDPQQRQGVTSNRLFYDKDTQNLVLICDGNETHYTVNDATLRILISYNIAGLAQAFLTEDTTPLVKSVDGIKVNRWSSTNWWVRMISPPPTAPKALVLTEDQYRVFRQDFHIDKVKKLSTELQNTLESESTESDHGTYEGSPDDRGAVAETETESYFVPIVLMAAGLGFFLSR